MALMYNSITFKSLALHRNRNLGHILELVEHPTWLGKLFDKQPRILTLVGSGTVWHFSPSGKRAGTNWEFFITELLTAAQIAGKIEDYY